MALKQLYRDEMPLDLQVIMADSWLKRLIGLLNRSHLADNEGLVLMPCASIHTVGMRFSMDAVFLSSEGVVLGIRENIRPFRFCIAPKGTQAVLELASGNAKRTGINLEQVLKFV